MYIHTLVVVSCLGGVKGEVRRGFIELVAKVRASQLVLSVTLLHITIARRKVKMCGFSSGNWFFFCCRFAQFAETGKRRNTAVHLLLEKSAINMI